MAVRRSSTILCASAFALAIAAFKVADVSFVGSKAATRSLGVARFEESGKRGHVPTQDEVTGRRPTQVPRHQVPRKAFLSSFSTQCSMFGERGSSAHYF